MKSTAKIVQNLFLIIFVLAISIGIGWYGERGVEKFIIHYQLEMDSSL